jgi:hypothetical protein
MSKKLAGGMISTKILAQYQYTNGAEIVFPPFGDDGRRGTPIAKEQDEVQRGEKKNSQAENLRWEFFF